MPAGQKFTANREARTTLCGRGADDAAETVRAAAQEAARAGIGAAAVVDSRRGVAGQAMVALCARGPQCIANGLAVNGFRTGKASVPWRAWLLPLCYREALSFHGSVLKEGIVHRHGISISSLSGVSGAGRSAAPEFSFAEVNESVKAYKVGEHQQFRKSKPTSRRSPAPQSP